jgi:hypothetical protein
MKPPLVHPDGSFELECLGCKEIILIFNGDIVALVANDEGSPVGAMCDVCVKKEMGGKMSRRAPRDFDLSEIQKNNDD